MNKKYWIPLALGISSFFLSGCEVLLSNLTPEKMPQNPSNIYTMSVEAKPNDANVLKESMMLSVVINGEQHDMKKSSLQPNVYTYEYPMPVGSHVAKYYYQADFKIRSGRYGSKNSERSIQSKVYALELVNRYVVDMEYERGFVGSEICVMGRGFTEFDQVFVGGEEAKTYYHSRNSISYVVPAIPSGEKYTVEVKSNYGNLRVGELYVDQARIRLNKDAVYLHPKERSLLVFKIEQPAPSGGLSIDVTTDVPDSIIMPEVIIPPGSRTVSVMIEGGFPGNGQLFIEAPGYEEAALPVHIDNENINIPQKLVAKEGRR